jgi:anti-sigma factor RsiW
MHAALKDRIERYLSGSLGPAELRELETHLASCDSCREEAAGFRRLSLAFGSLRSDEVWQASPGFYTGVMRRVEERRASSWLAGVFGMDLIFARRVVLTSAMTVALIGGYLLSRESGGSYGPLPVSMMAEQESPQFDSAPGPEAMLATLTAYVR